MIDGHLTASAGRPADVASLKRVVGQVYYASLIRLSWRTFHNVNYETAQ